MSGHGIPHHAENREQKRVGIAISVIAVILAIVSALAHNESNRMIVKEVKSSNGYAWYQAKRQRSYLNELEVKRIEVELQGSLTAAQRALLEESAARLKAKNAEYEKEFEEIRARAEADGLEAESAAHRHHGFEYGETILHVSVVLCSLMLLTEAKLFFRLGLAVTALGLVVVGWTLIQKPHALQQHAAIPLAPPATAPAHH